MNTPNDNLMRTEEFAAEEAKWLAHQHRQDRIEAEAKSLLDSGGRCHPWTHDHILEAIAQTESRVFTDYLRVAIKRPDSIVSAAQVVGALQGIIGGYWEDVAKSIAEKELK